jgi:hypothetical protein
MALKAVARADASAAAELFNIAKEPPEFFPGNRRNQHAAFRATEE